MLQSWYLTDTEKSAWLFTDSQNIQCMGSLLKLFIYGPASLGVVVSNIPTQGCLLCHTAEGCVPVMASREGNMRAPASAISIHSIM